MLALGLLWSKIQKTLQFGTGPDMIEKISGGVLKVLTPLGPRYIQPSFSQRLYLLWIFRNFDTLPHQVLTGRQRRLVETLCAGQRYVANGLEDAAVIGTLERRRTDGSNSAAATTCVKRQRISDAFRCGHATAFVSQGGSDAAGEGPGAFSCAKLVLGVLVTRAAVPARLPPAGRIFQSAAGHARRSQMEVTHRMGA